MIGRHGRKTGKRHKVGQREKPGLWTKPKTALEKIKEKHRKTDTRKV